MQKFVNLYQTQLTQSAAANATLVYVQDAPSLALAEGEYFIACMESVSTQAIEIVKITGFDAQANSLTLVRGQEETTALAFAQGDQVEIRLTAGTCQEFFQRTELATVAQAQAGTNDTQVMTAAKVKAALDYGLPVGSILAWMPGHFTAANNGGSYAPLFSISDVSNANAWLLANAPGWRVADGTELNLPGTLIWNAAGHYLPNLTDERFLMGGTAAGNKGGSNLMLAHQHNYNLANSTPSIEAGVQMSGQALLVGAGSNYWVLTTHIGAPASYQGFTNTTDFAGINHTHILTGQIGSGSNNNIDAGQSVNNRPQYLSAFYLIKVA